MAGKVWITVLIAALVIAVLGGGFFAYKAFSSAGGATVSAQGNANIDAVPDEVSIYLLIETKNASAQAAKDANLEITDKVASELEFGVGKENIQLLNYNIYPWTEWSNEQTKNLGYIVNQQIIIKLKDFSKVADVIDKSVNSGALVNSINFELSSDKQNDYKAQALKTASEDAKLKAMAIAVGQGKSIGELVSLSSQEFNYMPYRYYVMTPSADGAASAKQAAGSLSPTDIQVSAIVTAEYRLK